MSPRHRARRGGFPRWLLGLALVCALVVPIGLGALGGALTLPVSSPTSISRPPVTTTPSIRPNGGCPPGFGPMPEAPGACASPAPRVVRTDPTTSTRTRVTPTLPRTEHP